MNKTKNAFSAGAGAGLALLLAAQALHAAEYEGEFRAGIGQTDNIARTANAQIDETIAVVGFDFGVTAQTNKLNLELRSSFDYLDYLDNTYDSEVLGGLVGAATFTLIDERLLWVVEDTFGQRLFDPLEPPRPDNRENINFFSTGPTLNLFRGSRNFVTLDARYSSVNYETQDADNTRIAGLLSFGRDTGRESRLSLNVDGSRIKFDDPDYAEPIDRYAAYVRYEKTGMRNTFGIDVGYNGAESGGVEGDGVLLQVDWSTTTSANGLLAMAGGSRYSDQGNIFRFLQDLTPDVRETTDPPSSTNEPFLNYYYSITYTLDQERYSVDLVGTWSREDYDGDSPDDRDTYRGRLLLQREMSRSWYANAAFGFQRREFQNFDRRDDDLTLGLGLGYRLTASFALEIEYQHYQRNSIQSADFNENRAFLWARFTPSWSRRTN